MSNMSNMEAGQEMKLLPYDTFFFQIFTFCVKHILYRCLARQSVY